MVFNSIDYFWFMLLVVPLFYLMPHRFRWGVLLVASYVFYSQWSLSITLLLIFSTGMNYLMGRWMGASQTDKVKKTALITGLGINLGLLFFFMYWNFAVRILNSLAGWLGSAPQWSPLNILLPLGISFYTFQAISYLVDIYWGRLKPEKNLGIFALYMAFFPKLLAGPIERGTSLVPQLRLEKHFSWVNLESGFRLILVGLVKKMVIADRLAILVNTVYQDVYSYNGPELALTALFYTFQIYCDFSGYTDIAMGSARILGFEITQNFTHPYLARSVGEFWHRWHISLTSWFRDYVYIPLGGNKGGEFRTALNLLTVFLISGLWHGAALSFVFWGLLNGVYLLIERYGMNRVFERLENRYPHSVAISFLRWGITLVLIAISWIFFRAKSLAEALYIVQTIFTQGASGNFYSLGLDLEEFWVAVISIAVLMLYEVFKDRQSESAAPSVEPFLVRLAATYGLILIIIILGVYGTYDKAQFIYFAF